MAFEPFTKNDRPTMTKFNEKLTALYDYMKILSETSALLDGAETVDEAFNNLLLKILSTEVKIQTGSYSGEDASKKSLSFDFTPKCLIVIMNNSNSQYYKWNDDTGCALLIYVGQKSDMVNGNRARSYSKTGTTITYTSSGGNPIDAMNKSGFTYYYFAIGQKETQ